MPSQFSSKSNSPENPNSSRSLTVIVPALNEEANLELAIRTAEVCVRQHFSDYEILIFDDGSTDSTGAIADRLASQDPKHIKVVHHPKPWNLGGCYRQGLEMAKKEFVIMIPGDNECGEAVMDKVFALAGRADMIIPFTTNSDVRPLVRQVLSRAFVELLNMLSGCRLKYYNGAVLHKTKVARTFPITNESFAYQAELLVKLLRAGHSYQEVGTEITYRPTGRSKAFRLSNVLRTANFLGELAWEARAKKAPAPTTPTTQKRASGG